MKSDRKPPIAKSPIRARSRRVLLSTATTSIQSPPGSLTKSRKLNPGPDMEESDVGPEYQSISWELRALARMVSDEFGKENTKSTVEKRNPVGNSSPLFERGRYYDVYSARRNERLKRKKGEIGEEVGKTPYNLGVNSESGKKRGGKKLESIRKSVCAAYAAERSEIPRYSLRSLSKENRKPPLPGVNGEKSVVESARKVGARTRVRQI